jgi:acyl carrier protein
MDESAIIAKLTQIFRAVLENDSISLTAETTAEDVAEWDSMNHIFLVVEIERQFGIKFRTAEMEELKNVGDLAQLVAAKLAKTAG